MSSQKFEICVFGGGGVGKTSIISMFCLSTLTEYYDPTLEDNFNKQIKLDDQYFYLDILDTSGPEEFRSLRTSNIRQRKGFVLVYSITDKKSFSEIQSLYEEICYAVKK
jgi:small GTP-binding protein